MTTMEVDMDDISDFLRTCLHKEKAYQPCDFLRLRNDLKHQNKNARSAGGARGYSMRLAFNYQALDRWEMSTRSRWQIGQWFHRSEYCSCGGVVPWSTDCRWSMHYT